LLDSWKGSKIIFGFIDVTSVKLATAGVVAHVMTGVVDPATFLKPTLEPCARSQLKSRRKESSAATFLMDHQ
jgi:hypothetical protein